MALIRLPAELLDMIIMHAIPEGFESMATSCKKLHAHCIPFMKQHNAFRSRFHHFAYFKPIGDLTPTTGTAFDIITRIADEPWIARYVRYADFRRDGLHRYAFYGQWLKDVPGSEAIRKLCAASPYFGQAGLD